MGYTQRIIDIVYAHGCVKLEVLIDMISTELGKDREKVKTPVKAAVRRLVEAGVIVRRGRGYYCSPTAVGRPS